MKSILFFFYLLELENPIEFTDNVLPGCLDTNSYTIYDDVLIVGNGATSKTLLNPITGERHDGQMSRFNKQLEYKDISNKDEKCERYRSMICADSNDRGERYFKSDKNHFVSFKLIFPSF